MGGLGNQLFQFAAARRLARVHESELVLDLGWFRHEGKRFAAPRPYELGGYGLSVRSTMFSPRAVRAHEVRGRRFPSTRLEVIRQHDGDYSVDERVLNASDNVLLIGYWQSEAYFADVARVVRDELNVRDGVAAPYARFQHVVDDPAAVSVHVRRGDYVSSPQTFAFHGVLDRDYYRRAMAHLAERVSDPRFIAFSDDPDWVERELASDLDLTVVRGGNGFQELRLMSRCRHHVIANSSFSWWGAWLNPDPAKRVIVPVRWFNQGPSNTDDLIPSTWTRL